MSLNANFPGTILLEIAHPTWNLTDLAEYEASGTMFNVSGWGTLASNGQQPEILNVVTVPFVEDSVCKEKYPSQITDQMICAGNLEEGGTCKIYLLLKEK